MRRPDPALRRSALAVLAPFGALLGCHSAPPGGGASDAADVHSFARPERVRVTHVELDLELDFERREVRGEAVLTLERTDPRAPLVLDDEGLAIESVTGSDGTPRAFAHGRAPDVGPNGLGRPLEIELARGDVDVAIAYRTGPDAEALQWLEPAQTESGRLPFLFTQGQSVLTRSWIPLQDSPGTRVTYAARVRAPRGATVVMSAEERTENPDGSVSFAMRRPIPPYLIALACGDLVHLPISARCGVWADPAVVVRARRELEDTEAMIRSAEALFGPYRWGRYDVLILPPAFPFGGMENPCTTFATPTILAGDKSLVALVAHELAHSWSGNLVTNATWSDFWLNEGFTVYFEQRIMEAVYGRERALLERELAFDALERELDELEPRDQVLCIDLDGRHPDDGFSAVPYDKGSLFLHRLEQVFGREAFDRFLAGYFDAHAFRSITTRDFVDYLERELFAGRPERAARVDVERWLTEPGLPETAPRARAESLRDVERELDRLAAGADPSELDVAGWNTHQWLYFLEELPDDADAELLARLDAAFGLTETGNAEVLCVWLRRSVAAGYAGADARLEEFLRRVGRTKFLRPLYAELASTADGRERAVELYGANRARYHSVTANTIDRILAWQD